jgi:hypothetical protein
VTIPGVPVAADGELLADAEREGDGDRDVGLTDGLLVDVSLM